MGTFRSRPPPSRRRRGRCRRRASGSTISWRSGCARPPGCARLAIRTRGTLVPRGACSNRGRFGRASLRRCAGSPGACRTDGRTVRGDRAPPFDDRSGVRRRARRSACCSRSLRRGGRGLSTGVFRYRRAIAYLPSYVKARVHLAEICASQGRARDAEALLLPALSSGDPEVNWRLADVLIAQGKLEEAETQLDAARFGFDQLLGKHLLAFADHAAEFYAGSGNDCRRALELARTNVANRPTRRAVRQAHAIAVIADEAGAESDPHEARSAGASVRQSPG